MNMFGTNGVRGVCNEYMDCRLALRMGQAIPSVLGRRIAVAMDTRLSSPMLKDALSAGLMSVGADILDLGMVPTPALQLYVRNRRDVTGGVMITASHNPPEFNGIKCISGDGTECSKEQEARIEQAYDAPLELSGWRDVGTVQQVTNAG